MRLVIDTNTLISAAISPRGKTSRLLQYLKARRFTLLYSNATWEELIEILHRPHLRRKYDLTDYYLHFFLQAIRQGGEEVTPTDSIKICRDADDDKFLEVAVSGMADYLISNDGDLLSLSPYAGIPIISPREILARLDGEASFH